MFSCYVEVCCNDRIADTTIVHLYCLCLLSVSKFHSMCGCVCWLISYPSISTTDLSSSVVGLT